MALQIYNTLTRQIEPFVPADPNRVTMYLCGPTVYNYAHIGNARPAVVCDVLYRLLQRLYPKVVYARNITDVEDKINAKALEEGVTIDVITQRYTAIYREDTRALGVQDPVIEPHATDHIQQMIVMMEKLIASGHAYEAQGHVLFDVTTYEQYGALSRRSIKEMIDGARVEVAPYKRTPGDFVLWKPSDDTQPGWESPFGFGRPGWHIECSAMAESHLGETIDIHAGGQDLVFPHHENEVAQSVCAHGGSPFARYWVHNGFVTMESRKMAKSLGNVITIHDLLKQHDGEVLRMVLLGAHFRQPLDWSQRAVTQAQTTLDKWYRTLGELPDTPSLPDTAPNPIIAALEDNLNTPEALSALAGLMKRVRNAQDDTDRAQALAAIREGCELLGLLQNSPQAWFDQQVAGESIDSEHVEALIAARAEARKQRDFARADEIRDEIAALGVLLEDKPDGSSSWRLAGGNTP